ncbi:MAG: hypothetical protein AAF226_16335 [Verrucomicrobiota bacterium]
MTLKELTSEAVSLPTAEKAALASTLIESLPAPDYFVSDEEVVARMKEAERDPTVLLTEEEFLAGINRHGS